MKKSFKRIITFMIGYFMIFESLSLTGIKLTWWQVVAIILGGTIIGIANTLFPSDYE